MFVKNELFSKRVFSLQRKKKKGFQLPIFKVSSNLNLKYRPNTLDLCFGSK